MRALLLICLFILTGLGHAQSTPTSPSPAPTPRSRPCTAPLHRQFDFWIGRWDVVNPSGQFAGANRIAGVDRGCALHESWSSAAGGYTGQSLNSVDADGKWRQTWVDSSGLRLELTGGLVGASMVLEGDTPSNDPKAPPTKNRITWTPESPNLVRQHWETSADLGKTWTTAFDGRYHRVPERSASADSFLTRLQGGWIGTGQLMKRDSHVELHVDPGVRPSLFVLKWRSVVATDPRGSFEGVAMYADKGNGELAATWWDSQGATHPIKAAVVENAMTSHWGDNGRTVYTLLASGDLEVVDSVKRPDGAWGEFGRATLKKK